MAQFFWMRLQPGPELPSGPRGHQLPSAGQSSTELGSSKPSVGVGKSFRMKGGATPTQEPGLWPGP